MTSDFLGIGTSDWYTLTKPNRILNSLNNVRIFHLLDIPINIEIRTPGGLVTSRIVGNVGPITGTVKFQAGTDEPLEISGNATIPLSDLSGTLSDLLTNLKIDIPKIVTDIQIRKPGGNFQIEGPIGTLKDKDLDYWTTELRPKNMGPIELTLSTKDGEDGEDRDKKKELTIGFNIRIPPTSFSGKLSL